MGARIADLRQVAPGEGDTVAAIDGPQISGWIGIEEMPVGIGRYFRHTPHDDGGREPEFYSRFHPVPLASQKTAEGDPRGE